MKNTNAIQFKRTRPGAELLPTSHSHKVQRCFRAVCAPLAVLVLMATLGAVPARAASKTPSLSASLEAQEAAMKQMMNKLMQELEIMMRLMGQLH